MAKLTDSAVRCGLTKTAGQWMNWTSRVELQDQHCVMWGG